MLKSLELSGFKSFADRVRFDFGTGVTGIVGPNGSGKSNIVDALKWVLGEQSAKGLRGSDMTDVIFNGSAERKPMGMAEVTIAFDNTRGHVAHPAPELILTRRVYRSGESEYLLNGQPTRLRDLKDLFLGTGFGLGAYSIIEQGKVEQVLSASNLERRHLFEEAAGVSRFRAKKLEALRRLDRVEQNMVRARDIHDELEKQTKSLRSQAGKARSYREYADRLRELRISVALAERQRCLTELTGLDTRIRELHRQRETCETELNRIQHEREVTDAEFAEREAATQIRARAESALRDRIGKLSASLAAEESRLADLDREAQERRSRLHHWRQRGADFVAQAAEWESQLRQDVNERNGRERECAAVAKQCEDLQAAIDPLRREVESRRRGLLELEHRLRSAESEQLGLARQDEEIARELHRLEESQSRIRALASHVRCRMSVVLSQHRSTRLVLGVCRSEWNQVQEQHRALGASGTELRRLVAETRDRRTKLTARLDVLNSLRERREGLDGGVQKALGYRIQQKPIWRPVIGLLAEFLEADTDHADLIEVALGPLAQALLVRKASDLTPELLSAARALPGRVRFLAIDETDDDQMIVFPEELGTSLATMVECDESLRPLVDRILGGVILTPDLATARRHRDRSPELRFLTKNGELLEPDGSISAGPPRSATGIIARLAEIRDLTRQIEFVERLLSEQEVKLHENERLMANVEQLLTALAERESTLSNQDRYFDLTLRQLRNQIRAIDRDAAHVNADLRQVAETRSRIRQQATHVQSEWHTIQQKLVAAQNDLEIINEDLALHETQHREAERRHHEQQTALAVVEERIASLLQRQRQLAHEAVSWRDDIANENRRIDEIEKRRLDLNARLLEVRSEHAMLMSQLDVQQQPAADDAQWVRHAEKRRSLAEEARNVGRDLDEIRQELHAIELRQTELRFNLNASASRLRDDYSLDITSEDLVPVSLAEFDINSANAEIDRLRQKITRLGAVNVQAVEQLTEVENRFSALNTQISDLESARKKLTEIVDRINDESRRLFLETFTNVRRHFQQIYRKLFGGGRADLVLEDERDVLESPVEIVARPPGKEPRSLTLLSGGEKTMTAAALLMALFRSKPSPFCILDEVDAALDEANIGRFMDGLREFLTDTQFVLITHSKSTMACADVLHGVTQRESGVSIRVSVRLDDIAPDGSIRTDFPSSPAKAA